MIGAVVLVAAANILIPPMLSGPSSTTKTSAVAPNDEAAASVDDTGKLKTYTIDLSKVQPGASPHIADNANSSIAPAELVVTTPAPPSESPAPSVAATAKVENSPPESTKAGEPANSRPPSETRAAQKEPVGVAAPAVPGNWAVQVGSFGVRATSDRIAADLKRDGFSAFVVAFQSGNQTMYRVRVGPERDRAAAEVLLRKLKLHHPNATLVPPP